MLKYIFFILIFFATHLNAQNLPVIPFQQNFNKSEYKGGTQNWDILQTDNNIMYFANNHGVLRFDGYNWSLKAISNKSGVRSLCKVGSDSLLVGAYGEFGIIYNDEFGEMQYESWMNKVPEEYRKFHEVWRIFKIDEKIYVQSFSNLLIFNSKGYVKCILPHNSFKYMHKTNNGILIQDIGVGVFGISADSLVYKPELDYFKNKEIWSLIERKDNKLLIATQLEGVFVKNKTSIKPWNSEANEFVRRNNLFTALEMNNGNYVFGTIQGGYCISDANGRILSHQNAFLGLQNNTVLSLFEDHTGNLWLGLDNGIDFIKTNSSLYHIRKKGGLGMGYSSQIFNNILYLGTNQGLHYLPFNGQNIVSDNFSTIESINGQVWKLTIQNDKLYCCHNLGLYEVVGNRIVSLFNETGVWDMIPHPTNNDILIIGTYNGFISYNKKTKKIIKLLGFNESARKFVFDPGGNILVSHIYKGIYKLSVDLEKAELSLMEHYNGKNKLPDDFGNELLSLKQNIYVSTNSGVYKYANGNLIYDSIWNKFFNGKIGNINTVVECSNAKYFCFSNGNLHNITWLSDKMYTVDSEVFESINKTFQKSFENVLELNNHKYLIGNEDGFILYDDAIKIKASENAELNLTAINYIDKTTNEIVKLRFRVEKGIVQVIDKLSFKNNNIVLSLSMPYFNQQSAINFRYRLNKGSWANWNSNNSLNLSGLREGDYVIDIQSNGNSEQLFGELSVLLSIEPPLHRRWYSYLFYLIFFFASTLISSYIIKQRINNARRRELIMQQKRMIEHRIKLKRKAEVAQTELTSLKNEKLKTDIRHKSKELANTTMSIIQKNQILQQIKDVLLKMGKNDSKYMENKEISRLIKKINKEIEHQDNWTVFEKNFDKVHENFLQRLKEKHAELTPKDLRLAAYLRMNLSSKEIAPLLNISVRSVEISRYRLRKKMILPHDQNLTEYLIKL